jgi:hypothetical protein
VFITQDPNDEAVPAFLEQVIPDLVVARRKWPLRRTIYSVPGLGTFVLRPGICPQYRNAHGRLRALAADDPRATPACVPSRNWGQPWLTAHLRCRSRLRGVA